MVQERDGLYIISDSWFGYGGTYVLRMRLNEDASLAFGKFTRSKIINLSPGEFTYVGSAMAEKGSMCLAQRLLHHASRTGDLEPHAIRETILKMIPLEGLAKRGTRPPKKKTLFWNVDHLLNLPSAELMGA